MIVIWRIAGIALGNYKAVSIEASIARAYRRSISAADNNISSQASSSALLFKCVAISRLNATSHRGAAYQRVTYLAATSWRRDSAYRNVISAYRRSMAYQI